MYSLLFKLLGHRKKLSILIYHQVLPEPDFMRPYEMHAEQFDKEVSWLAGNFNLMTLDDALTRMHEGRLPSNAAVITFDDGYENNVSQALPILSKHGVPASFFIASDFLNGGAMWNDKVIEVVRSWQGTSMQIPQLPEQTFDLSSDAARHASAEKLLLALKYLPFEQRRQVVAELESAVPLAGLMMTDAQVKQLHSAGMEIGGHTCSHPILAKLDDERALRQIVENKQYLESLVGQPLRSFAYPNGKPEQDYSTQNRESVRQAGYRWAVSTSPGVSDADTDPYQVPRFSPWRKERNGFLSLLAKNYFTATAFV